MERMTAGKTSHAGILSESEVEEVIHAGLFEEDLAGKRVLVIVPDSTRTAPLPLFYRVLTAFIGKTAKDLHFLVALGTHPPMREEEIDSLLGRCPDERQKYRAFNHHWNDPHQLTEIGRISAGEIEKSSRGLFREEVKVSIN